MCVCWLKGGGGEAGGIKKACADVHMYIISKSSVLLLMMMDDYRFFYVNAL